MFKNAFAVIYSLIKEILKGLIKFKEVIWGIFFGIISGGIGAILAVSYIELSSTNKDSFEKSEIYESILSKFELLEKKVNQIKLENQYNQEALEKLKSLEKEIYLILCQSIYYFSHSYFAQISAAGASFSPKARRRRGPTTKWSDSK